MGGLRRSSENGLLEFFTREMGLYHPRNFSRAVYASQNVIKRLDLYGKMKGHQGCVNTIAFNSTGDTIVSGSDDRHIMLWDWAAKKLKFSYPSGHLDNIFQAKIMPFSDDRKIVTSSADCQVRLGELLENGSVETKRLSRHQGRVHCIAVEPGSPYEFYSCGQDGLVQRYDLRSCSSTKLFHCSMLGETARSSSIGLNSIDIDPRNPNYIAVGGADVYIRVYDIRKCQLNGSTKEGSPVDTFCPPHLIGKVGHITALAYSNSSELLVSYNDELIYLFQKNMGLGPKPMSLPSEGSQKSIEPEVYSGHLNSRTVKGVNFVGPNDEYVVSGSDCGHIFIWKKKGRELVRMMLGDRNIVNQIESHPLIPVLASCGIDKSIKIWGPSSKAVSPLPENADKILEDNRQGREEDTRVALTPDVIMHVLRLHRRQAQLYDERRLNREDDAGSDEDNDDREAYLLGFLDGDPSEDGGPRECNIN